MSKLFVGSGLFLLDALVSGWALSTGATLHAVCGVLLLTAVGSIPLASGWAKTLLEGRT